MHMELIVDSLPMINTFIYDHERFDGFRENFNCTKNFSVDVKKSASICKFVQNNFLKEKILFK